MSVRPEPAQPWLHELVTVLSAPTVVLSERSGQIRPGGAHGALHADTRVLSMAVLEVGGTEPTPAGEGRRGAGAAQFTAVPRALGDRIPDPTVWLERHREVTPGRVTERIRLVSAARSELVTEVVLRVAADLATISEVKAGRGRPLVRISPAGPATGQAGGPAAAMLSWGDDARQIQLTAPGASASTGPDEVAVLRWLVRLASRGTAELSWELAVTDRAAVVIAANQPGRDGHNGSPWTRVRADAADPRLSRLLGQSLADAAALRMATVRTPGDTFLAAGAPWFLTLFGRDSIWAARMLLPFGWQLAAGTLRTLAAYQGRQVDWAMAEAPGKIPHELRTPRPGRPGPDGLPPLYYGTIDATPLWICLLHDAWRWGMPADQVRSLLPNLTQALACLRDYGDADGDGFLEYIDDSGHGLANQGWKDSGDSVRFADGRIAAPPVALCEVQGYAFEAAMAGAALLDAFGEPGAARWRAWAARLAAAFRAAFWVADAAGRYPALALDAGKRPVDSVTSNIGHLLGTGLLTPAEERLVAARLAGPEMDSGFGLRTMSATSSGYSPLSYHCGSVWSHDTAIVIRGLFRSGQAAQASTLVDGLLEAAAGFGWRLPELYSGESRAAQPWPSPYPAACRPQAWSAAAAGAIIQALLGLDADVPGGTMTIAPPGDATAASLAGSLMTGRPGGVLHVEGLVAGSETFSAGVDAAGHGYLRGLSLAAR